jgi:hypothetical protein
MVRISSKCVTTPEQGKHSQALLPLASGQACFGNRKFTPKGTRNQERQPKRLPELWDRKDSTSGPTPLQLHDNDDDDDLMGAQLSVSSLTLSVPN